MHIEVARDVVDLIRTQALAAGPRECCGILLGEGGRITQALATPNSHALPETHFEIDAQSLIDAHRAEREGGPGILGYYHSHPTGEAAPSATDQAMAAGDGRIWVIVAGDQLRFWRDAGDEFVELSYEVIEG
ncbi:Desampylase [Altererythrobacter insulae]|nr:Desampylase [Altererythrobacter insulae]